MSEKDSEQHLEDMRAEYDFSGGVRGKHYQAYHRGCRVLIHKQDGSVEERDFALPEGTVILDPDARAYFPGSEAVNHALHGLLDLLPHQLVGSETSR